jgi:hypothetical protein
MDGSLTDGSPTDRSPGTKVKGRKSDGRKSKDGSPRTEVQGRKSHGRKSAPQHQRSPRHSSPVSFVAMAMATWSCSGASSCCYSTANSRHYSTTSLQRYNAAARIAVALRRCCSTHRGNAAATRVATTLL